MKSGRLLLFCALCSSPLHAQGRITIVAPVDSSPVQRQSVRLLQEEAASRSRATWEQAGSVPARGDTVVVAEEQQLSHLLSSVSLAKWRRAMAAVHRNPQAESFSVASLPRSGLLVIAGQDERGLLFGVGWLLRNLPEQGLPHPAAFFSAPERPVRGYQIGYRMKNNTYDAWTLQQFEQQARDLAVFGMNTIQVIAPVSDDDRTSPLFHAPPQEVITGLSAMTVRYGLRFDLYYPEMANNYRDPVQVQTELDRFEGLVKSLPKVDSLHVPGGDPGHTAPEVLFPLLQKEALILRRYHPDAQVWVSAQGFTQERFERFYQLLNQNPAWLTGVFFGPQSRDGQPEERRRIPKQYPLEFYPDIGHTMHAQFPVPDWDPLFALTEGREPICPRPRQFTYIYRHFAPENSGFIAYSEGVNDDVNKFLWARLGWDSHTDPEQTLREYGRYFLGARRKDAAFAHAVLGLEKNWSRPLLAADSSIQATHQQFLALSASAKPDWRWHSLLYRDTYDRYLQIKRGRELEAEQEALRSLRGEGTAASRVATARQALSAGVPDGEERLLHQQLEQLAGQLFHEIGLQLSVPKYGASNWERGANLDRIDTPLNDRSWLEHAMGQALQASSDVDREARLMRIADWQTPPAGSFYDDLGDPTNEAHLVRGASWLQDPEMYHRAIDGIADRTLAQDWRLSWLSYAETLYEDPLSLHYEDLDPEASYTLRVTQAGEDYSLPMSIVANGLVAQSLRMRRTNPEEFVVPIPQEALQGRTLTISWLRQPGAGGSGRGGQVAEVWLLKSAKRKAEGAP